MKKLPLAIAFVSLFAASTGFSQQFNQDFRVSLDIPSSIDVSAFQQETIELSLEELKSDSGTLIGEMAVKTTASACYATITTDNNFQLVGPSGGVELPYVLDYIASSTYYNNQLVTTPFSAKNVGEQKIGCGAGALKMRLAGITPDDMATVMKAGAYNDVIRVEVRTNY